MSQAILDWSAARHAGPEIAGGKGWQLGVLADLGAPVPPGFVIAASASMRRRSGDPMPASLVEILADELQRHGWDDRPLAVRSSAAQEDSRHASFAGIHLSRLNVCGLDAVVLAVQAVWDSAGSAAAIAYRQRLGISNDDGAMAVVVMPLLVAVSSGIAFTCDPHSGRRDQIVIHANWGLGESLVSGQVNGDEYRLQENHVDGLLAVIAQRQGDKARFTALDPCGGTTLLDSKPELAARSVLSTEQAITLGELVRDTAYLLDYAAPWYDVEWVWDGECFWIVQARPVTTMGRYTYPALASQPSIWSRGNSRDVVPDPLSPMDISQSAFERILTRTSALANYKTLTGIQRISLRNGRLYFDASVMQWEAFDAFDVAPKAINQMMGGHQPEIAVPMATIRQRAARIWRSLRFIRRVTLPRLRARKLVARTHEDARNKLEQPLPSNNTELASALRKHVESMRSADDLFLLWASGSALYVVLDLIEKHCPGESHALTAALMANEKPSVTAQQGYALLALANVAANDPVASAWLRHPDRIATQWSTRLPETSPFRKDFQAFLDEYGHRAIYESYLRNPRWREAPGYLLDSIVGFIGHERKQHGWQQKALVEARQQIDRRMPLRYRLILPTLIRIAANERNIREATRSAYVAQVEILRRYVLTLGQHLSGSPGWDDPEIVFNLTLPEWLAVAEGHMTSAIAGRRAAWRQAQMDVFMARSDPEVIIEHGELAFETKSFVPDRDECDATTWHGIAVGGGQVSGIAHVARHPLDAVQMEAGAILVAPSTDPAWTPLFLKASALVTETGGYLSHGAIVAREFGIPAVVNVPGILERISSGDRLEVDGNLGRVRAVSKGEAGRFVARDFQPFPTQPPPALSGSRST